MTYEEFKQDIYKHLKNDKPEQWRDGQFVFNHIEDKYKVARDVQLKDGIDCFYNNDKIEDFLTASYNRIMIWQQ